MKRLLLLVLFVPSIQYAQADFLADRCYSKTRYIGDSIRRLYLGYSKRYSCRPLSTDQCFAKYGKADKITTREDGSKVYYYYGKKKLYYGTGYDNKSVGKEWRELLIKDGKIVSERETVQIMEHGYSWMTPSKKRLDSRICEDYGRCKSTACISLEPITPLPQVAKLPRPKQTYTDEQLFWRYMTVMQLTACQDASPAMKTAAGEALSAMRDDDAGLMAMFEKSPEFTHDLANAKKNSKKRNPARPGETVKMCQTIVRRAKKHYQPADPRKTSPDGTWRLFISSLEAGDSKTAIGCLSGRANTTLAPMLSKMTKAQLREMANSFNGFKVIQTYNNSTAEAVVTRKNNRAGFIYLQKAGSNWYINGI